MTYLAEQIVVVQPTCHHSDPAVQLAAECVAQEAWLETAFPGQDIPDDVMHRHNAMVEQLARTPSRSVRGIYEKLAVIYREKHAGLPPADLQLGEVGGDYYIPDLMVDSVMLDARRLAEAEGGPLPAP